MNDCRNDDYSALRQLFSMWKVSELFDIFKGKHLYLSSMWMHKEIMHFFSEEGINMAELEMIRSHHIHDMLKNYKMGVRIKFEHHLEIWRRERNKPIKETTFGCTNCSIQRSNSTSSNMLQKRKLSREVNTEVSKKISRSTSPVTYATSTHSDCLDEDLTQLPDLGRLSNMAKRNSAGLSSKNDNISLVEILNSSGLQGANLVDYYRQHKKFTPPQRVQLIAMIVSYFESNMMHLTLNMSHNIETQIINLFPSEKLEYYRTEKRGKIYIKYNNIRRYRKERGVCRRKATDSILIEREQESSNTLTDQDDEFYQIYEMHDNTQEEKATERIDNDVEVKLEYLSE